MSRPRYSGSVRGKIAGPDGLPSRAGGRVSDRFVPPEATLSLRVSVIAPGLVFLGPEWLTELLGSHLQGRVEEDVSP